MIFKKIFLEYEIENTFYLLIYLSKNLRRNNEII